MTVSPAAADRALNAVGSGGGFSRTHAQGAPLRSRSCAGPARLQRPSAARSTRVPSGYLKETHTRVHGPKPVPELGVESAETTTGNSHNMNGTISL